MTERRGAAARPRPGTRRGQIAVIFLALMAFVLVLVGITVNVGQMAQVRTEVSNAADAGALAGASWMASGQNEAAWIARKMWDAIWMTKALYLVPFCDGQQRTLYANVLWSALARDPSGPGVCQPGFYLGCGPNGYFREVANGAMEASWSVGAREYLTATLNNMMMRLPVGGETGEFCITIGGQTFCYDTGGGNLPANIRQRQEALEAGPDSIPSGLQAGLDWTNGLTSDNPLYLEHHPWYNVDYPSDPPRLVTTGKTAVYAQYHEPITGGFFPYFPCELASARGITEDIAPILNGTPGAPTPDLRSTPARPLTINPNTGAKRWDMDLANMIPRINELNFGACEAVCGMAEANTPSQPVAPGSITGGEGQVVADTAHEVTTGATVTPGPDPSQWVTWNTRFQDVTAQATASFTPANVSSSGITDLPERNATAQLTEVR